MALARMIALEAVGLVLADVEPALRDRLGVGCPVIRAVKARVPAPQAGEEPVERGAITTAAFPVNQAA